MAHQQLYELEKGFRTYYLRKWAGVDPANGDPIGMLMGLMVKPLMITISSIKYKVLSSVMFLVEQIQHCLIKEQLCLRSSIYLWIWGKYMITGKLYVQ